MSQERLTRNDAQDRRMISAAQFAHEMSIPNEEDGEFRINQPGSSEGWLRKLFEKAVAGYYRVKAPSYGWQVSPGKRLRWPIEQKSERIDELLPQMQTDIFLEHSEKAELVIIDTKFTNILRPGQYRAATFKSEYVYQIYSYIRSQQLHDTARSVSSTGILLHPSIGEQIDESVTIQDDQFRFATLDLAGTASLIGARLLKLLEREA